MVLITDFLSEKSGEENLLLIRGHVNFKGHRFVKSHRFVKCKRIFFWNYELYVEVLKHQF